MSNHNIPIGLKKTAVICILRCENEFLLLKRSREPNKGLFTPVGGKLDPFENPYSAAIRETHEETGIKVDKMQFCGVLAETSPTKYNWMSFVYLADIQKVAPPPCNEGDLEWIHFNDLLQVPTPKTDWFIYKYVMENKHFIFTADFDDQLYMLSMKEEMTGKVIFDAGEAKK